MRKQGENAASIAGDVHPEATRILPRLAPGGFYREPNPRVSPGGCLKKRR